MAKKIMTLDNLYRFFVEQNKSFNFSSKESGQPIVVTTNGNFAEELNDNMPGMLKLKLKNCHIDTNRNGSHISKENMEKAMPTLKYRPILAYIHELPDGTKDFYAHNIQIEDIKIPLQAILMVAVAYIMSALLMYYLIILLVAQVLLQKETQLSVVVVFTLKVLSTLVKLMKNYKYMYISITIQLHYLVVACL